MKPPALRSQLGALTLAFLLLVSGAALARAQAASDAPPTNPGPPEESNQTELWKAYLQVREQLHTTQLAIVNNRVEATTEKIEALRKTMELDRERQQAELQRAAAQAERRQMEIERSNRATVWAAAAFGGAGLLAMLMIPWVQARALKRAAVSLQALVPHPHRGPTPQLMASSIEAADETVSSSTNRLISIVERMERRIKELEGATSAPVPTVTAGAPINSALAPRVSSAADRRTAASDRALWITVLLNKAQNLIAANKPQEAIACYDEILGFDPSHAQALVKKGAALERMNRFEEALEAYDLAIEADSRMTLAHLSKGGMCNRLGRHSEAIASYERALQVEAKSA